jgi:hypothetical protein
MHLLMASLVIIAFTSGCATVYDGLPPNLRLHDTDEVQAEVKKFSMQSATLGRDTRMDGQVYSWGSAGRIVKAVSPTSFEKVSHFRHVELFFAPASVFLSLIAFTSTFPYSGVIGVLALISGVSGASWSHSKLSEGYREYNIDLEKTFVVNQP